MVMSYRQKQFRVKVWRKTNRLRVCPKVVFPTDRLALALWNRKPGTLPRMTAGGSGTPQVQLARPWRSGESGTWDFGRLGSDNSGILRKSRYLNQKILLVSNNAKKLKAELYFVRGSLPSSQVDHHIPNHAWPSLYLCRPLSTMTAPDR